MIIQDLKELEGIGCEIFVEKVEGNGKEYISLQDGTEIEGCYDGRYFDPNGNLWVEIMIDDGEYDELYGSGHFYKV